MKIYNGSLRMLEENNYRFPIRERRSPTDTHFIFVFMFIVVVWLSVGIQAFVRGSTNKFDNESINDGNDILLVSYQCVNTALPLLSPPKETFGLLFLFTLLFSAITLFDVFIFIKLFTRTMVCLSLIILTTWSMVGFGLVVKLAVNVGISIYVIVVLVCASIYVVYAITILFCVHKAKFNVICVIVHNSIRSCVDCFPVRLFAFTMALLEILAIAFTMNGLKIILSSGDHFFWILSFSLIIVSGGIVVGAFVYLFAMAVIAQHTLSFDWIANKNVVSCAFILRPIARVCRYHLGTIAMESTLIVPFVYAGVLIVKYRNKYGCSRKRVDFYIDSLAKIVLGFTAVHSVLIVTSISGSNFAKATKSIVRLVTIVSPVYLVAIQIIDVIFVIGIVLSAVCVAFTFSPIVTVLPISIHDVSLPFFWGFYPIALTYFILTIGSGRALLINKMTSLREDEYLRKKSIAVARIT